MPLKLQRGLLTELDRTSKAALVLPFTLREIEDGLELMKSSKAPGLDEIYAGVLKALWNNVKEDLFKYFADIFNTGFIPAGMGSSFIALIPKSDTAVKPSEYRPISLMNVALKLQTNELALRLRTMMKRLVSESKSVFIQNRQMSDCIIITTKVFLFKIKEVQGSDYEVRLLQGI